MNRLRSLALGVVWVALIFCFAVNRTQAQAARPRLRPGTGAEARDACRPDKDAGGRRGDNPFAPSPPPRCRRA